MRSVLEWLVSVPSCSDTRLHLAQLLVRVLPSSGSSASGVRFIQVSASGFLAHSTGAAGCEMASLTALHLARFQEMPAQDFMDMMDLFLT